MMDNDGVLQQAQHLWTMLDDMAENNPEAYQRFIQKQLKDGAKHMQPPQPAYCIQVTTVNKQTLYINICGWSRIPTPKSESHPIPIKAGKIHQYHFKKKSIHYVDVAFSDDVVNKSLKDAGFQKELILLAMTYVYEITNWKLVNDCYNICQEKYRGDIIKLHESLDESKCSQTAKQKDTVKVSFGNEKNSVDERLFKVKHHQQDDYNEQAEALPEISNLLDNINLGNSHQSTHKKNLIEEISPTSSKNENIDKTNYITPENEVQLIQDNPSYLLITIRLPEVQSVSQCELDISQVDLCLHVPEKYRLNLDFPEKVNDNLAKATFSKKNHVLKISIPTT